MAIEIPKKTYTHLEALALAAQNPGRVFLNSFGTKVGVNVKGYPYLEKYGPNFAAFRKADGPYTDPEPEPTDDLVNVLRRTTCRTEPQCKEIAEAFRAEMRKMINGSKVAEFHGPDDADVRRDLRHTITAPEK